MKTKIKTLFATILATLVLSGCSFGNSSNTPASSYPNTQVPGSGGSSMPNTPSTSYEPVDPIEPGVKPMVMTVTQNKEVYVYGQTVRPEDFVVEVKFSNGTKSKIGYKGSGLYGWFFHDISINGKQYDSMPNPLNITGNYQFSFGYKYNDNSPYLNAKKYYFNVTGGISSDTAPQSLSIEQLRSEYAIGDVFSNHDIVVTGHWDELGDEIIEYGGKDGYALSCSSQDLSKPFVANGQHTIYVTFRGVETSMKISVSQANKKSKVDYTYKEYNDDTFYETSIMPLTGNPKALIIPVWFQDSSNYVKLSNKNKIRKDIENAYLGTPESTGWHSVKSYYYEDSYQKLNITGVVSDWYNTSRKGRDVTQADTTQLVLEAADWYKSQVSQDVWNSFDTDKDGYLDAVVLIYAFPNFQNMTGYQKNQNLWAYCYWVQDPTLRNPRDPGANVFFWASYDFMYAGLSSYSPMIIDGHTYIHEMGHILGLVDYYDYNSMKYPAGGFSMQDMNVGAHDIFSKLAYGWIDPYVPTESGTYKLYSSLHKPEAILLSPDFTGSAFDEYLLLEYYTPDGLNALDTTIKYDGQYPQGATQAGVKVWHVDSRLFALDQAEDYLPGLYTRKPKNSMGISLAMTNTTDLGHPDDPRVAERPEWRRYHLLALLNESSKNSGKPYAFDKLFNNEFLWKEKDTFRMEDYLGSFPNRTKLNSGKDLGFSFKVLAQNEDSCTIAIEKH